MILDDIVIKRKEQLEVEKKLINLDNIKRIAKVKKSQPNRFYNALNINEMAVISEVKKASPSKGIIKEDFDPLEIAAQYQENGANAISVLTEEHYFKGNSLYLRQIRSRIDLPILRKDFIIDEYQIYEARMLGADAILLIVAILDEKKLKEFMDIAEGLNLDCLVEVHDKDELDMALKCNARIIGINNRNLKTFEVDLHTTIDLARYIPDNCLIVSESGIATNEDMKLLRSNRVNAVLIGETLMRSNDIGNTLNNLRCGV